MRLVRWPSRHARERSPHDSRPRSVDSPWLALLQLLHYPCEAKMKSVPPPTGVFNARALADGRVVVRALLNGTQAELLLDTGALLRMALDWRYVARLGLSVEQTYVRAPEFARVRASIAGTVRLTSIEVLGSSMGSAALPVYDFFAESPTDDEMLAGVVGIDFFQGAVLALDMKQGRVQVARTVESLGKEFSGCQRLRLLRHGESLLPFTSDVQDAIMPGSTKPVLIVDTGATTSALTIDYITQKTGYLMRRWLYKRVYVRHGSQRSLRWLFALPDGAEVQARVRIVGSGASYADSARVDRVDGLLGAEILSQWHLVFDLIHGGIILGPRLG